MPANLNNDYIVITGATGLIGTALCAALQQQGEEIVLFSRNPQATAERIPTANDVIFWEMTEAGPWVTPLDGAKAVIHLAGGPIFTFGHRQTKESVAHETQRRIKAIRGLVQAMAAAKHKPRVFISASSVGSYGYRGYTDDIFTEESPPDTDFWSLQSKAWEGAALDASLLGVRPVVLRTSYVLDASPHGGLMQQARQFRSGWGGPVLPGRQWLPWIHLMDEVGLIQMALADERIQGPLNCTAPEAPRNREFAATLGKVLGKPARVPVPGWALRMGLGITADIIIHGRRVLPHKALDLGYTFHFPHLESALQDLLQS